MYALEIKNLVKNYGKLQALKGLDLIVPQGAFFGLLGPNGAGKTTTINILSGLANLSSGEVKVFGHDLLREYRVCRNLIGLVPQEFNFDMFGKVHKILMFQGGYFGMDKKEREVRARQLCEEFDLADKWDVQARMLSGGMKRRLIIARALMHRPKLLILDEPTAGVDVDLRKSLWRYVRRLNEQGTTIILTTHYIEEAEALCDEIAIINHGNIIAQDHKSNLVERLSHEVLVITTHEPWSTEQEAAVAKFKPRFNVARTEATLCFDRQAITYHEMLLEIMASGVNIRSIRPSDNRLERVFIELTKTQEGQEVA